MAHEHIRSDDIDSEAFTVLTTSQNNNNNDNDDDDGEDYDSSIDDDSDTDDEQVPIISRRIPRDLNISFNHELTQVTFSTTRPVNEVIDDLSAWLEVNAFQVALQAGSPNNLIMMDLPANDGDLRGRLVALMVTLMQTGNTNQNLQPLLTQLYPNGAMPFLMVTDAYNNTMMVINPILSLPAGPVNETQNVQPRIPY